VPDRNDVIRARVTTALMLLAANTVLVHRF